MRSKKSGSTVVCLPFAKSVQKQDLQAAKVI